MKRQPLVCQMNSVARTLTRVAPGLAAALFAAGCAATRVDAEWTDPAFAGKSLRGAKVPEVCDANDPPFSASAPIAWRTS